jgi:hypothetical protein
MDANFRAVLFIGAYTLVPIIGVTGFFLWNIKRRGERLPVEFALRRAPGETLRRKIAQLDEDLPLNMILLSMIPLIAALSLFGAATKLGKDYTLGGLVLSGGLVVVGMAAYCGWLYRHIHKRRNYLLGYLGERAVAEELEPLLREGYHVFHDVPVEGSKENFNLDHVVVGSTGLFAIETKTRRKGRAREGFDDHKVFYDGRQLIWPWAEDSFGLKQAQNEADWLTKWVRQMTGIAITAKPILALPGWWVETRALGPVAVQNPKNIPSHIRGKSERVLSEEQIQFITRQLDVRCRDVKD